MASLGELPGDILNPILQPTGGSTSNGSVNSNSQSPSPATSHSQTTSSPFPTPTSNPTLNRPSTPSPTPSPSPSPSPSPPTNNDTNTNTNTNTNSNSNSPNRNNTNSNNNINSPSSNPVSGLTPSLSTALRTITQGSGSAATVVVVTQTIAADNPVYTGSPNSDSNENSATGGGQTKSDDGDTSRTISIVVPCVIAAVGALIGLFLLIRCLRGRSATAKATEDIRWPEIINSEGDRAALYPEPTRPGQGHGLGNIDDEDEELMMSGGAVRSNQLINMTGAGAAAYNPNLIRAPSSSSPPNPSRSNTLLTSTAVMESSGSPYYTKSSTMTSSSPTQDLSSSSSHFDHQQAYYSSGYQEPTNRHTHQQQQQQAYLNQPIPFSSLLPNQLFNPIYPPAPVVQRGSQTFNNGYRNSLGNRSEDDDRMYYREKGHNSNQSQSPNNGSRISEEKFEDKEKFEFAMEDRSVLSGYQPFPQQVLGIANRSEPMYEDEEDLNVDEEYFNRKSADWNENREEEDLEGDDMNYDDEEEDERDGYLSRNSNDHNHNGNGRRLVAVNPDKEDD